MNRIQETNASYVPFNSSEDILSPPAFELDDSAGNGRIVFTVAVVLLASYFYALPFIKMPWGYLSYMRLDDIITPIFFLFVVLGMKNHYPTQRTKAGKLVILIMVGMLVSFVIARFLFPVFWLYRLYPLWTTVRYIHYLTVFLLVTRVVFSPRRLVIIMWVVFLGGMFVSFYALAQYYGYISPYYLAEMFKEAGIFETLAERQDLRMVSGPLSPNHAYIGTMLGTVLIFSWALLYGRGTFSKLVLFSVGAIMLYTMLLTRARAPVYALPLAAMATMLLLKGRVRTFFISLLGLLLVYFTLAQIPELGERFLLTKGFAATTGGARVRAWLSMFGWLGRHPIALITGIGFGSWQGVVRMDTGFSAAHNNYIHFLIEGGVIGLAVFLLAIAMAIKHCFQIAKSPLPEISRWGQAMFTVVIYLSVSALSQENFVPSGAFGSFLGYCLFLLGVTYWAKQYVDERTLMLTVPDSLQPTVRSGEYA